MQPSSIESRGLLRLTLTFVASLVASIGTAQAPGPSDEVPEGLSAADWSSIRQAYEANRHAAYPVAGGYQACNPGQRWRTRFDGRGFLCLAQYEAGKPYRSP